MPKLVLEGSGESREYELRSVSSIGRHPKNSIQLLDGNLSKEHAQIVRTPEGGYKLRDLGSANGTFVNDQPVQSCLLQDGDLVRFGECQLRFVQSVSGSGAVTLAPSVLSSHVQQRVQEASAREFPPAAMLGSVGELEKSYTGLRSMHMLTQRLLGCGTNEAAFDATVQYLLHAHGAMSAVILTANADSESLEPRVHQGIRDAPIVLLGSTAEEARALGATLLALGEETITIAAPIFDAYEGLHGVVQVTFDSSYRESSEALSRELEATMVALGNAMVALQRQRSSYGSVDIEKNS